MKLVGEQILDLMSNPHGLGRPAVSPPYPPGGMVINFEFKTYGYIYAFSILYNVNEIDGVIEISGIGHSEHSRDEEWPDEE